MANRDIVAIGTSAGGVEALIYLARRFPAEWSASVLVTIHLSSQFPSSLDELLSGVGKLRTSFARDGELLDKAHIYLAPPDRHLLLENDRLILGDGPRENNARPAIDPMLRSVATCCAGRAIGVVLTGTLGDGASGLWAINRCGGTTVVQDPRSAAFAEMPRSAIDRVQPDHVVELEQIPTLLKQLTRQPATEGTPAPENIGHEVSIARGTNRMLDMDRLGRRSVFSCPDCQGVMWEIEEGDLTRFRCHVGHAYTADIMNVAMDENLRRALGSAQRVLEERLALAQKLHRQAVERRQPLLASSWEGKASDFAQELEIIRASMRRVNAVAAREHQKVAGKRT